MIRIQLLNTNRWLKCQTKNSIKTFTMVKILRKTIRNLIKLNPTQKRNSRKMRLATKNNKNWNNNMLISNNKGKRFKDQVFSSSNSVVLSKNIALIRILGMKISTLAIYSTNPQAEVRRIRLLRQANTWWKGCSTQSFQSILPAKRSSCKH